MTKLLDQCAAVLGQGGVLTGADVRHRLASWNGGPCLASAILRPCNTNQVAEVLRLCHAARQPVVTQGGKTGKVEGCLAAAGEFALSLERMQQVVAVDATTRTITVQAGAALAQVQAAANAAGLLFPLDMGSRGSATIGGNIATNAGGNRVLRYGMMRHWVLGLEAVLANGTVISSLDKMIKNNAGYDLKQLFIGSEGTLGIVTQAVLKLAPRPTSQHTALAACSSLADIRELLATLESQLGGQLSAFEVMWQDYYELATADEQNAIAAPLSADHPYYVLLEADGYDPRADQERFDAVLTHALQRGLLRDAVLAKSLNQRDALWAIRDNVSAYLAWRPVFSFDVSLDIAAIDAFVGQVRNRLIERWPSPRLAVFGHLGDGNIHLAVAVGDGSDDTRDAVNHCIYHILRQYRGSISAEHGIGLSKRDYLQYCRSPEEIALMQTLKQAMDPLNILNPGKVIHPATS